MKVNFRNGEAVTIRPLFSPSELRETSLKSKKTQGQSRPRQAAQLELGRVCQKQGDTAKARIAYQNFLAAWKDADPDVPLLHEAKAEYAKLQ